MLIDLHVHSHHTRGCALAPRDVLRRAKESGLDGVAFTDLNTLDGLEEIRAAGRDEGVLALCGVEIATDRGHYLCFFPDPSKVPPPPQLFGSAAPSSRRTRTTRPSRSRAATSSSRSTACPRSRG